MGDVTSEVVLAIGLTHSNGEPCACFISTDQVLAISLEQLFEPSEFKTDSNATQVD